MSETNSGFWWCPECGEEVQPIQVTFSENHELCGQRVIWKEGERGLYVLVPVEATEAAQKLCEIYFNIAADLVGEEKVRELRDSAMLSAQGEGK